MTASAAGARTATPVHNFDKKAGVPKLEMMDFSVLGSFGGGTVQLSKEELFERLWNRIIDQLEGQRG